MPNDDTQASPRCESTRSEQETRTEFAVLTYLIEVHPVMLTLPELVREMTASLSKSDKAEETENAVRELIAAGLLHRVDTVVAPTYAALYFAGLIDSEM